MATLQLQKRALGGIETSALGYGAMVLTGLYGAVDAGEALDVIRAALDLGVTLIDTSDAYGPDGSNETLVGRAIAGRDEAMVATKWGIVAGPTPHAKRVDATYTNEIWVDARPERAADAAAQSIRRIGVEAIDLWYLHFPHPGQPIEEIVGAMADVVRAGDVRHIGLSNVTAEQLRRAHSIHPITAIQVEYSLWTRDIEVNLLPTARELGVGIVAWGPLGNGFLAAPGMSLAEGDFRHNAPRFQRDALKQNADRFAPLRELADELAVTPAQLALSWLLHQGDDIVPIPGTRSRSHLQANLAAAGISLDSKTLERMEGLAPIGLAMGASLLATHSPSLPLNGESRTAEGTD